MPESFKDKRAVFLPGKQRGFLTVVERKISLKVMSRVCKRSERTIRDWRREKFAMDLACVYSLCRYARVSVPAFRVRDAYAHVRAAGAKGARTVIMKYGRIIIDEKRRRAAWQKWWESTGKLKEYSIFMRKSIRRPPKDAHLAEFVGIVMGDGGISEYQIVITLHHKDDLAYSKFVTKLMEKLFGIEPRIYHDPKNSINDIVISRRNLVEFLHKLGLPLGNKVRQEFDIPDWIQQNGRLAVACVRGLVDTDGSVITHRYAVKGKRYEYKKLSFTSRSAPLRVSVAKILTDLGMHARISGNDVRLDSIADMKRYFRMVGSHNPKHLKRYENSRTMRITGRGA